MGLEAGSFISDFVPTNPVSTDQKGQGDDHLRLVKTILQTTFPNASKAFYFPTTVAKTVDFTVLSTEPNKTFLVDTTAGAVTATLPSLAAGDAGWECFFIKTNTGTNPYFVSPASGTIQSGEVSGLTKTRRSIPGHKTRVFWTGTAWIAERVVKVPVGAVIEFAGTALPVGYEWPNGTALSSSANYPDYNAVRGGLTTPDRRGRIAAGKDDMGGSSANRLTNQSGGLNGDTFEATGGSEVHTLVEAELAAHDHGVTDPGHFHGIKTADGGASSAGKAPLGTTSGGAANMALYNESPQQCIQGKVTGVTVNDAGGGGAHNNVQPTIIENFILVVE